MSKDELISEYRRKLHQNYYAKVLPIIQPFEKERKRCVLMMGILFSLLLILLLIIVTFALLYFPKEGYIPIILIAGWVLYHYSKLVYQKISKNFKQKIKTHALDSFLSVFDDVSKCANPLNFEFLNRTGLFISKAECFEVDDAFSGYHNGIEFQVAEVKDNDGTSGFNGVILVLPSNKTIKGKTIITSKNDTNTEM